MTVYEALRDRPDQVGVVVLRGPSLADGIPWLFAEVRDVEERVAAAYDVPVTMKSPVSGVSGGEATAPGTVLGGDS